MAGLLGIEIVFFDAAGTLFEVNGSVGEVYHRFAKVYGLFSEAETIEHKFRRAFPQQPPLTFPPALPPEQLKKLEFEWWRCLVREVFADHYFPRFDEFFAEVFEYFRRPEAWRLFDDVLPALESLKDLGLRMAIISNFDSRLEDLLTGLRLEKYFEAVHLSSRLGAAKPDPIIFLAALAHHGVAPERALHIGDNWREDFEGARAAGLNALLLERKIQQDYSGFQIDAT